jgi:chemotaxis protein CheX
LEASNEISIENDVAGRGASQSYLERCLECAAIEVFEMMAGVHLEANPSPTEEPKGEHTAMVGLAGALCGTVTVRSTKVSSSSLASAMLGGDAASNPSTISDALGELCNMVAGNFKTKVSSLADQCMLSVPTVISGEDYSMEMAEPNEGIAIPFMMDGKPVWVTLVLCT